MGDMLNAGIYAELAQTGSRGAMTRPLAEVPRSGRVPLYETSRELLEARPRREPGRPRLPARGTAATTTCPPCLRRSRRSTSTSATRPTPASSSVSRQWAERPTTGEVGRRLFRRAARLLRDGDDDAKPVRAGSRVGRTVRRHGAPAVRQPRVPANGGRCGGRNLLQPTPPGGTFDPKPDSEQGVARPRGCG